MITKVKFGVKLEKKRLLPWLLLWNYVPCTLYAKPRFRKFEAPNHIHICLCVCFFMNVPNSNFENVEKHIFSLKSHKSWYFKSKFGHVVNFWFIHKSSFFQRACQVQLFHEMYIWIFAPEGLSIEAILVNFSKYISLMM